jgi:hypothetical protein
MDLVGEGPHWADEERWSLNSASGHTQIDGTLGFEHSPDKEQTSNIATASTSGVASKASRLVDVIVRCSLA